jgi:hypothetical protein
MIETGQFLDIICSRKKGASKKEINETALKFGYEISPYLWYRIHYAISNGGSINIYCKNKRWFSFENYYYKRLVKFVNENEKEKTHMGMAMGCVPSWITDNHKLFNEIFKFSDF